MKLNEINLRELVNHKRYPLFLSASLFGLSLIFIFAIYLNAGDQKFFWTVFGAELLFFMLINAFSFLMVSRPGPYLKRIIIFYLLNLFILVPLLVILIGDSIAEFRNLMPAFGALVFCFFASLLLVLLIRSIVNFFREG